MQKISHPTTKNIYFWALISAFGLVLMNIAATMDVTAPFKSASLLLLLIVLGYGLIKTLCGIIFNGLYADGGVLSVLLLEVCFFGLCLSAALL